jgi:dipeptide transport system substrate-binding protein
MRRIPLAIVIGSALGLGLAPVASAKTLIFCSEGSPETFNPQLTVSLTAYDASARTIYDRLVEPGANDITPSLAESWEISADGLAYTFHLRRGARFQTTPEFTPTRELNADDVIFSFERQWQDDHPYHRVSGGAYELFDSLGLRELLQKIERVDDHTVRFVLRRPSAVFLADLGSDFAAILSAEHGERMLAAGTPERVDLEPVGTGPFQLVRYDKDAAIRYRAHPGYWRGRAPLDDLTFAITPDSSVRWEKLRAGECHVLAYPNPADLDIMRRDPNVRVLEREGFNISFLAFNTEKPPFDDVRVRQALNLAVDKRAIVDAVFQGKARPAKNPIPPAMWSYNDAVEDYPHDPIGAKRLLAEAGHPDGFATTLWAMPIARPYNPNPRRMAELIQADWAEVGVRAKIVSFEWGEYLQRSKMGEHETMLLGWVPDPDPDSVFGAILSCTAVAGGANRARWCHPPYDALQAEAARVADRQRRVALYGRAQVIFKEQAPWITIAHATVFQPVRKEVVGYEIRPFGGHQFYGVDLKER